MSATPLAPRRVMPRPVSGAELSRDGVASLLLYLPLIAVTVAAKFAIPLGEKQIPIPLLVLVGTVAFGLLSGRLKISPPALAVYLLALSGLGIMQVGGESFSYMSLLLLAAILVPLVINLESGLTTPQQGVTAFQNMAAIIALSGILQYAGQYVIGVKAAFPIEHFTPASLIIQKYNYLIPLHHGSPYLKSNGIFLLEPSFFSQLSAISLIVELIYFHRLNRVMLLTLALAVAYSGTGLVILAVVVPALLITQGRFDLVLLLGAAAALLGVAAGVLHLGIFAARLGTFTNTHSSAFARFVGQFSLFEQFLWPDFKNAMIGMGAGAAEAVSHRANLPVAAQMAFTKILLEYGILGSLLYGSFFCFCLFRPKGHVLIKIALLIGFCMNGTLVPWITGLAAPLLIWPSSTNEVAAEPHSPPKRRPL
jgi:hypothetical protein